MNVVGRNVIYDQVAYSVEAKPSVIVTGFGVSAAVPVDLGEFRESEGW